MVKDSSTTALCICLCQPDDYL